MALAGTNAAAPRPRASRMPARLDLLESGTGLFLALFMLVHTLFAASILLGPEASATMARAFEGYYLFGRSYPAIVGAFTTLIILVFVVHAVLAMRKAPSGWAAYSRFHGNRGRLAHADTTLWWWQVVTGAVVGLTATIHLYHILANPGGLGPYESASQVWSGRMWPLYLVLLPAVELHVGIGLYRLAMKWGWFEADRSARTRRRLKLAMWGLIGSYVLLGLAALGAYAKLGYEQALNPAAALAPHAP